MDQRIDTLLSKMKKYKLDAFLIVDCTNMNSERANTFYLSGFQGTASYILITHDAQYLFTDCRYIEYAKNNMKNFEILLYDKDFKNNFRKIIKKHKIKTIGFEKDIHFDIYTNFVKMSGGAVFKESSELLIEMRRVKDEHEIDLMRTAIKENDKIFADILKYVRVGLTENQIARKLRGLMDTGIREGEVFPTIIAADKNSAQPHYKTADCVIKSGDFLLMDFGVKVNNYCSDMTRTLIMGKPSAVQKKIYDIVLTAQLKAIKHIKSGVKAKDIDAVARDYISSKGYGDAFGHGLGHGLGLECHEFPVISPRSKDLLEEGMIFTVEPGIYLPEIGGVRIEDNVLVTKDGCEVLSSSPKELICL